MKVHKGKEPEFNEHEQEVLDTFEFMTDVVKLPKDEAKTLALAEYPRAGKAFVEYVDTLSAA